MCISRVSLPTADWTHQTVRLLTASPQLVVTPLHVPPDDHFLQTAVNTFNSLNTIQCIVKAKYMCESLCTAPTSRRSHNCEDLESRRRFLAVGSTDFNTNNHYGIKLRGSRCDRVAPARTLKVK